MSSFSNKDWLELLFQDRHKEYGAFRIRGNYNSVLIKSILITGLLSLIGLGIYFTKVSNFSVEETNERITELDISQLSEAPVIETPPPPPPPPEPIA